MPRAGYVFILYSTVESLPTWALFLRSQFGSSASDYPSFYLSSLLGFSILLGPMAILSGATLPLLFDQLRQRTGDLGAVAADRAASGRAATRGS